MAIHITQVDDFLRLSDSYPILDVRSPGEYAHAHVPGAFSLPIFSDEERKVIGTTYKQVSRNAAVKVGLDYFAPNMRAIVEQTELTCKGYTDKNAVLVHCWRGGMRSEAMAWLLNLSGFEVYLLEGGYKSYRHWVINHWHDQGFYRVLGGYTGTGKTAVLEQLRELGAPVLNLEEIARHKGSAFGDLDKKGQPSQEMFENLLATEIHALRKKYGQQGVIWIEDESQRIGDINLPIDLYRYWSQAPIVFLNIPFEQRLDNIVLEYGKHSTESLINAIVRIKKRLGPLETKTAINYLIEGDIKECFRTLLLYYDKHYTKALVSRPNNQKIESSLVDAKINADLIKNLFS